MMHLTEKQEALLKFIEDYQLHFGKSPTVKEMRDHFGLNSDNSIVKIIKILADKGCLEKDNTPRGIRLLNSVKERFQSALAAMKLPLIGEVPAGGPVLCSENKLDDIVVGEIGLKDPEASFLLRVRGDSMCEAGIYEGDIVIVNSKMEARPGDIVVALVDSQNTVKRYMKDENGRAYLKPENKVYQAIYPEANLQIQGVVTGLMRSY